MTTTRTRAAHPRHFLTILALALSLCLQGLPRALAATPELTGSDSVFLTRTSGALAPGLNLTSFQRLQPGGWVTGHVMVADLNEPTLSLDVVDAGTVSGTGATVSELARTSGAVAAINGDFFDMNRSGAPVSTNVSSTQGVRTASTPGRDALTIARGLAAIQRLSSGSTVTVKGAKQPIEAVNSPTVPANGLGLFTPAWGSHDLGRLVPSGSAFTLVLVKDGKVTQVSARRADLTAAAPLPTGTSALLALGTARARLSGLAVGATADIEVRTSPEVDLAVSGAQRLVTNGVATAEENITAARTAVGISKDGSKLYVASIDGRLGDAHGMTITELTALMLELGAWNAVNLDGGGSTTLVGRLPGSAGVEVINRPSDGNERLVANALVFKTSAPATLNSVQVKPSIRGGGVLMPGLTRTLEATGLSTALGPVRTSGEFSASGSRVAVQKFDGQHAIATGVQAGPATVTYSAGGYSASTELDVLGPVERLQPSKPLISLLNADQQGTVELAALDADGRRAPVETRDVTVDVSGPVRVEASDLDTFAITPTAGAGSAVVTFTVAGRKTTVPVTIGTTPVELGNFADLDLWKTGVARATGTISSASGPDGEPALRAQYDFTTSTATRGFYVMPKSPIPVPGQPQKLTMWVNGDGKGSWLRLEVTKGDGVVTNLNGPEITFTGWRQVEIPVPVGTPYPLTLTAIRFMETKSTASYRGDLAIAGLAAQVPASVDLPPSQTVADPVIVTNGSVDGRPQRIAVMSDAQFVAAAPHSDLVAAARRTLREIVAAKPDFLFVVGDLVDLGSPADMALAKKVLDEELAGKVGYQYIPGNHEIYGTDSTANFSDVFGATHTSRDLAGTRFITLDSSSGTLHPKGSTIQLAFLEKQLADARTNPAITGVVVMHHHPINDPLDSKNSQLTDRYEAAALLRTLADFRRSSGKSVAEVSAHVGVFHASTAEGVSLIINGNSGKGPASSPDKGGFTGWTMLGIDPSKGLLPSIPTPADRLAWLRAETHARVDELSLDVPSTLSVGESTSVGAQLTQYDGRIVPVAWPVSAQWGGEGVRIDSAMDRPAVGSALSPVVFDPATRQLKAVGAGTATLTLTVNGVRRSATVTVTGATARTGSTCYKKGTAIRVTGAGFVPGATVTARLSPEDAVLSTGVAGPDGTVTISGSTLPRWKKGQREVELWVGSHHAATTSVMLQSGNC